MSPNILVILETTFVYKDQSERKDYSISVIYDYELKSYRSGKIRNSIIDVYFTFKVMEQEKLF